MPSRAVEQALRQRCQAGEWAQGERLPAVAELAQEYGVARNTIMKALRRLSGDGLIEIVPNWGTFRKLAAGPTSDSNGLAMLFRWPKPGATYRTTTRGRVRRGLWWPNSAVTATWPRRQALGNQSPPECRVARENLWAPPRSGVTVSRSTPRAAWRGDHWPCRNALSPAASATAMRWRNAAFVRRAASLLLRMFAHSMNTFGTVDRFSPPRSVRTSRPAAPT